MGFFDVGDVGVDIERLPLITDGPIYIPVRYSLPVVISCIP